MKYLSNRLLSLVNLNSYSDDGLENLDHVTIRWDHIYRKWEEDETFRMNSSRTAVNYVDRQDPSLVTDICRNYDLFNGATGAFLFYMFMFIRCFLDKSLTVRDRIYWVWRVKSFFMKWSESVPKTLFITSLSFADLNSSCDGLIKYFLKIMNKNIPCVPWFLGTDLLEQIFGKGSYAT